MELPNDLKNEIWDYCRVNNISNIETFTIKMVRQGFTVERFGATPNSPIVPKVQAPKEEEIETIKIPITLSSDTKTNIYGE